MPDTTIFLSSDQHRKLTYIGERLGRDVYDLATTSIDEAILDWERANGEIE